MPDRQFSFKEQGAQMNLQSGLKLLAISVAAICWVGQANAQMVTLEASGTVDSLQGGGWGAFGGNSNLGQAVTLDFSYDSSAITESLSNNFLIESASLTSASMSGAFGSGINLESNGKGSITDQFNLSDGTFTSTSTTSGKAPSKGFSGEVFGFSFFTDGVNNTLDVVRNAFTNGMRDARDSGTAVFSNVSIGQAVGGGQAPEIDPASALSALTLLAGGLAVIRGRKLATAQKA
jgi:hypothetical protein